MLYMSFPLSKACTGVRRASLVTLPSYKNNIHPNSPFAKNEETCHPLPKQDIQNVYDFCTKCIHQKYTFCITKDQLGCIHFVYVRYTFCMQHLELKQTNKCIQNVYITHIVVYKMYTSLTLYTKCIH